MPGPWEKYGGTAVQEDGPWTRYESAPATTPTQREATLGEKVAGFPLSRIAVDAASPLIAAGQAGAHAGSWLSGKLGGATEGPGSGAWVDEQLRDYQQVRQRGKEFYYNKAGMDAPNVDIFDVAGYLLPAAKVATAVKQVLPEATGVLGRLGLGAAQGGAAALATPTSGEGDFLKKKVEQGAIGGLLGLGSQGAIELGKGIKSLVSPIADLFRGEKGAENIVRRGYEKEIGKQNVPAVVEALEAAKDSPVSGYKRSAGRALAYTPEGNPVVALEKGISETTGGPSADFMRQMMKNKVALDVAERTKDVAAAPLRDKALELANRGKVQAADVLDAFPALKNLPDVDASKFARHAIGEVESEIARLVKPDGTIDAAKLYGIRKQLWKTISGSRKEGVPYDKEFVGIIERDVQKGIDWAMNNAIRRGQDANPAVRLPIGPSEGTPGPTVWDEYLKAFSGRSRDIENELLRNKAFRNPLVRAKPEGSRNLSTGENVPHLALLSRPVVIANAMMRHLGRQNVEPVVDALATRLHQNPAQMAEFLRPRPMTQTDRFLDALSRQLPAGLGATAARAQE